MKNLKILQIIPSLSQANGVASFALNYYRNTNDVKMDFILTSSGEKTSYYEEIEATNSKIYDFSIKKYKSIYRYIREVKRFFKEKSKEYDIVHCNVANYGLLFLYYAKKYNIKVRIIHSHGTSIGETSLKKIINKFVIPLTKIYANEYFACSKAAGYAMFKNKNYIIINNAIEIEKFKFNKDYRKEIRNEFSIKNQFVLGTIGRISDVKNQIFILEIIKELSKNSKDYKAIIVGNGPLEETLKKYIKDNQLEDIVILTGPRKDVYKIYSAFDAFLLPSLHEGLPVVGIEAQCNGLPCLFSKTITPEVGINSNVYFCEIENIETWIDIIGKREKRCDKANQMIKSPYNIKNEAKNLVEIYIALEKKYSKKGE